MLRSIKSPARRERRLVFHVDGTGTASIVVGSPHATLVDNSTGNYTLTFTTAATRALAAFAQTITAGVVAEVSALSATAVTVLVKATADGTTATDGDFYLEVVLADAAE